MLHVWRQKKNIFSYNDNILNMHILEKGVAIFFFFLKASIYFAS